MSKIDKLLKSLNSFISKAQDTEKEISEIVQEFEGKEVLPGLIEDYETAVVRLFREQKKYYVDALNNFVTKDETMTIESFLIYMSSDLFAYDEFAEKFGEETAKYLRQTIEELSTIVMESIDPEIPFEVLSKKTIDWIDYWSKDLGELMQLNTHKALQEELKTVVLEGESIAEAELRMKDLPEFDRKRARATARTEILTAASQSHYESFMQSPAVTGKKWKHSGAKKTTPRATHVAMDGVSIPVNDHFFVDGEEGLYPRDPAFSAKNRVNCGCVIGPVVDETILGLTKEEKEAIRQEVLEQLNG